MEKSKYFLLGPFAEIEWGDFSVLVENVNSLFCGTLEECGQQFFKEMKNENHSSQGRCKYLRCNEEHMETEYALIKNIDTKMSFIRKKYKEEKKSKWVKKTLYESEDEEYHVSFTRKKNMNEKLDLVKSISYEPEDGSRIYYTSWLIPTELIQDINYDFVVKEAKNSCESKKFFEIKDPIELEDYSELESIFNPEFFSEFKKILEIDNSPESEDCSEIKSSCEFKIDQNIKCGICNEIYENCLCTGII